MTLKENTMHTIQLSMRKTLTLLFSIMMLVSVNSLYAEKSEKEYIQDLSSNDAATVKEAAKYVGKEKVTHAIDPLINVANNFPRSDVRISAVSALGMMEEKGKPTTALKDVIMKDADNDVVYASLLSILNLKDFENADAAAALDYCEKNKMNDIFIADIVKRIRVKMSEE